MGEVSVFLEELVGRVKDLVFKKDFFSEMVRSFVVFERLVFILVI